ncbi:MAG: hypothetical protein HQL30_12595, partial [Candidatus Omnitrophica bacterium]|nr:hypothetical protein [Candidatus Omnitrophota bacterium]
MNARKLPITPMVFAIPAATPASTAPTEVITAVIAAVATAATAATELITKVTTAAIIQSMKAPRIDLDSSTESILFAATFASVITLPCQFFSKSDLDTVTLPPSGPKFV